MKVLKEICVLFIIGEESLLTFNFIDASTRSMGTQLFLLAVTSLELINFNPCLFIIKLDVNFNNLACIVSSYLT